MSEEEEKEEKGLHAKPASLLGQVVAALWIIGFGSYYIVTNIATIKVTDIILLGLAIAAAFTPVYFNLVMEKIKDIRWG
jgi:hypothetical protein